MSAHAVLGPSSAYRWLTCTPSARFEEQLKDAESVYAAEGDVAHAIAALILEARAGLAVPNWDARVYEAQEQDLYTAEMWDYGEDYADFVRNLGDGRILVEHQYDLGQFIPAGFGTTDATKLGTKVLYIFDYKFGAGVRVTAYNNPQMKLYALGALLHAEDKYGLKYETVSMSIFQPRVGLPSTWEMPVKDLYAWAFEEVRPQAALAMAGLGNFVTGGHCQFCKARTSCKAFYDDFSELLELTDKRVLTSGDIAHVVAVGPSLKSWIVKIEKDAIRQLERGQKLPGLKLIKGRGKRSFKNEGGVVEVMLAEGYDTDDIYNYALRPLTELEKKVGPKRFKVIFENEIINLEGLPQIALENDDRPAIKGSVADAYD